MTFVHLILSLHQKLQNVVHSAFWFGRKVQLLNAFQLIINECILTSFPRSPHNLVLNLTIFSVIKSLFYIPKCQQNNKFQRLRRVQRYLAIQLQLSNRKMFKIKPSKKYANITSSNSMAECSNIIQLDRNNDIISQQGRENIEIRKSDNQISHPNGSLRHRSGLTSKSKINVLSSNLDIGQKSEQQKLLQKRTKQKTGKSNNDHGKALFERPSTSSNLNNRIAKEIKQKLINRRGNGIVNASSQNQMRTSTGLNTNSNFRTQNQPSATSYISNEQAQSIMLHILDSQPRYRQFRLRNGSQFQRVKYKLLGNTSIIVLKWYKVLQDQLYNQVKTLSGKTQAQTHSTPTVQQVIRKQIERHLHKQNGLFIVEQKCLASQNTLGSMIDGRLQELGKLLINCRK